MPTGIPRRIAKFALLASCMAFATPTAFGQDGNIQDILNDLRSFEFDEFVDASYIQVLLRNPELVTSLGLSGPLGIRDDQLDNICNTYVEETYQLKAGILEILREYDRSELDRRSSMIGCTTSIR
jgi:hypothetical protein